MYTLDLSSISHMKIRDNLVGFLMISDDNFEWPNCVQYSHLCCAGMTKSVIKMLL